MKSRLTVVKQNVTKRSNFVINYLFILLIKLVR